MEINNKDHIKNGMLSLSLFPESSVSHTHTHTHTPNMYANDNILNIIICVSYSRFSHMEV